jgi:hypothetical protein
MATRTIELIQFHSGIDLTGGCDDVSRNLIYYVSSLMDEYDFNVGEDDDGDSEYETRDAVSVFDCLQDLLNEENAYYVSSRGLRYSTIEIEVEIDADDKPILKTA